MNNDARRRSGRIKTTTGPRYKGEGERGALGRRWGGHGGVVKKFWGQGAGRIPTLWWYVHRGGQEVKTR